MDSSILILTISRIYLAIFFTLVAVFYTWRILSKKKQEGHEIVFPGKRFCSTWWNHIIFRFFRAAIWLVCLVRVPFPEFDYYLGVFTPLYHSAVIITGILTLSLGFVITLFAHYSLGKQWRSGIDPDGPGKLVTEGMYSFTRNPMFMGIGIAQLGFFLALPTIFSLLCLIVGLTTLSLQTKAEELHLSETFKKDYLRYQSNVSRWV